MKGGKGNVIQSNTCPDQHIPAQDSRMSSGRKSNEGFVTRVLTGCRLSYSLRAENKFIKNSYRNAIP
jgi:hypothetical protein